MRREIKSDWREGACLFKSLFGSYAVSSSPHSSFSPVPDSLFPLLSSPNITPPPLIASKIKPNSWNMQAVCSLIFWHAPAFQKPLLLLLAEVPLKITSASFHSPPPQPPQSPWGIRKIKSRWKAVNIRFHFPGREGYWSNSAVIL